MKKPMKFWAILDEKGRPAQSVRHAEAVIVFTNKKVAERFAREGGNVVRVKMTPVTK